RRARQSLLRPRLGQAAAQFARARHYARRREGPLGGFWPVAAKHQPARATRAAITATSPSLAGALHGACPYCVQRCLYCVQRCPCSGRRASRRSTPTSDCPGLSAQALQNWYSVFDRVATERLAAGAAAGSPAARLDRSHAQRSGPLEVLSPSI